MQCVKPWYYEKQKIVLPCGHCVGCRVAKTREWFVRLYHEQQYYDDACFITLTYDQDHIPKNRQISKEELSSFMKRLRNYVDTRIKYFGCGEYGQGVAGVARPHYHAILLGTGFDQHKVENSWNYQKFRWDKLITDGPVYKAWQGRGQIGIGAVVPESIRYVTGYVAKKLSGKEAIKDGRVQPFAVMSRGIGARYVDEHASQLIANQKVTVEGVECGMPKYYARRLDIEGELGNWFERPDGKEFQEDMDRYGFKEAHRRRSEKLVQKEKNIIARNSLFRKGSL